MNKNQKIINLFNFYRSLRGNEKLNLFIIDKTYETSKTNYFFATTSLEIKDLNLDALKEFHLRMVDKNGNDSQVTLHLKLKKLPSTVINFKH